MTTTEKKSPSWLRNSDSDDESIVNQRQLNEEQNDFQTEVVHVQSEEERSVQRDVESESDDSDDDDETDRPSILPANLQVRESNMQNSSTKHRGGLFRRKNDAASISTDRRQTENDIGSVTNASHLRGFSGNSVQSFATISTIRSVLSRFLPFAFKKQETSDNSPASGPPAPRKKPVLAPSKRDTGTSKKARRPPLPPRPTQKRSEVITMQEEAAVHLSMPDPSPTHKSISTMDTEECTHEGGVPTVIYCFIKVDPYENDDVEDDLNNSSGLRSMLPSAIAKRLPKRKQPKSHIDENDEESYFQTLVAL